MYALQTGIERKTENSLDNLMFHYHNYDRKYYVLGVKDKYYGDLLLQKLKETWLLTKIFLRFWR